MTCGSSEPVATVGARPTPVRVRSDTEPQTEVSELVQLASQYSLRRRRAGASGQGVRGRGGPGTTTLLNVHEQQQWAQCEEPCGEGRSQNEPRVGPMVSRVHTKGARWCWTRAPLCCQLVADQGNSPTSGWRVA
jgi:hypothetical protein